MYSARVWSATGRGGCTGAALGPGSIEWPPAFNPWNVGRPVYRQSRFQHDGIPGLSCFLALQQWFWPPRTGSRTGIRDRDSLLGQVEAPPLLPFRCVALTRSSSRFEGAKKLADRADSDHERNPRSPHPSHHRWLCTPSGLAGLATRLRRGGEKKQRATNDQRLAPAPANHPEISQPEGARYRLAVDLDERPMNPMGHGRLSLACRTGRWSERFRVLVAHPCRNDCRGSTGGRPSIFSIYRNPRILSLADVSSFEMLQSSSRLLHEWLSSQCRPNPSLKSWQQWAGANNAGRQCPELAPGSLGRDSRHGCRAGGGGWAGMLRRRQFGGHVPMMGGCLEPHLLPGYRPFGHGIPPAR
jgi:hypothetical protein